MATTVQLIALGQDGAFRSRCRNLVYQICAQVYSEDPATTSHAARASFASKVVQGLISADQIINVLVTRTNISGSTVTPAFDQDGRTVVNTDASDAAILSQIATDWNLFAGV